jgi:endogenous inhibitor of DNA gyrase (YacG/DUF329 family)
MKCPICGKPTKWKDNPHRPFCSERCQVIDLGRWAGEEYSVSIPLKDVSEDREKLEKERPTDFSLSARRTKSTN